MTVLTVDIPFVRAIEWSPENQLTTDLKPDESPSIMQARNGTIWAVWQRLADWPGLSNYELFYKTSSDYGLHWSDDKQLTFASGHDTNPSIMQASNGTIWVVWGSDRTPLPVSINVDDRVLVTGWDGWAKTGASPWLDAPDYPTNYINSSVTNDKIGNFTFADIPTGLTWSTATLCIKTWKSGDVGGSDQLKIYLYNGTKWQTYTITPTSTTAPGFYEKIDVTNFLNSEAAINAAKMALEHVVNGSADTIGVDRAYIRVNPSRNYDLFYKISSDNGASWSSDIQLTTNSNRDTKPSIMEASNGTIWVVWCSNRTGNYELWYKTYNGSAWSTDKQLTYTTNDIPDMYPSIMQARNGTIWVVWSSCRPDNYDIFYKTFNGTAWSSDPQLTTHGDFDEVPSIAQDVYGKIWVIWQSDRAPNGLDDLYYRVYDGSAWSPNDIQLTSDSETDDTASIAQIDDGKIWIVWTSYRDENFNIYYKTAQVRIPGDINGDGTVNNSDLSAFSEVYGSEPSVFNWDEGNFNRDNKVDTYDLFVLGKNYGKSL